MSTKGTCTCPLVHAHHRCPRRSKNYNRCPKRNRSTSQTPPPIPIHRESKSILQTFSYLLFNYQNSHLYRFFTMPIRIPDLAKAMIAGFPIKCWSPSCSEPGLMLCTGCKESIPQTYYCSRRCQKGDWKSHKSFCNKHLYTFDVQIMGSQNPPIIRRVAVPAWFTFGQFHRILQNMFMLMKDEHSHIFQFLRNVPNPGDVYVYSRKGVI